MRLWKVVAVLVVLSLLAVGGWLTVHLADWFSMPELDTSLLTDDPCVAPCWQNIIPGVTTEQEARSLLKGSPFVRKDSLDYAIANWKSGGEGYDWFVWNGRSKKYRNALYLREGKTVLIQLHVDYTLTAGQVANKFGPPERVYAKLTGGGILIAYLDYLAQGLRFTAHWSPRDHTELNMAVSGIALLTEDREIVEVAYFAPGPLEEVLQNPYLNAPVEVEEYLKRVQEWEGFGYIPCYQ